MSGPRRRTSGALPALALWLVGGLGCGGGGSEVPPTEDASATVAETTTSRGAGPGDAAVSPAGSGPGSPSEPTGLENFALPVDPRLAAVAGTVSVRIENASGRPLVVSARAGAEPVLLDTLDSRDELRVDLAGPPGAIEIAWTAVDGSRSGVEPVAAGPDSVIRLRLGESAAP